MAWIAIWFGMHNTCGGVWLNGIGQNRETDYDEEHDEDCVEEEFDLARLKFDRDGEGSREARSIENRSINAFNIWYFKYIHF